MSVLCSLKVTKDTLGRVMFALSAQKDMSAFGLRDKKDLSALCVRVALGEKRHGQSVRLYLCLVQFSLHFAQLGLK